MKQVPTATVPSLDGCIVLGRSPMTKRILGRNKNQNISLGAHLQFQGLVYHHHDREHGNRQAGMVPKQQLSTYNLIYKIKENKVGPDVGS